MSVAVVTKDRPYELTATLQSLRAGNPNVDDVVVSDDSDDDGAVALNRKASAAAGALWQRGPRRGLAANRNAAILACCGTHIRTVDDDHLFPPGHWEICHRAVEFDPESVWAIGEISGLDGKISTVDLPAQLHPRGFSVKPVNTQDCWAISDGATIYPRYVFDAGHRFDESFRFGQAYLEFGSRLYSFGVRIRVLDATFVFHRQDMPSRSSDGARNDLASALAAGLSHSFLYQRNPRNMLLTTAELTWQALFRGQSGRSAVALSLQAFRRRRMQVPTRLADG
jgi:glycosyltransferase involved in cell wall biosynthesis